MALSRKVAHESPPDLLPYTINPDPVHSLLELQEYELKLLSRAYTSLIPDYLCIQTEYNNAQRRAINTREDSLFPSTKEWNPPGRMLTERQRELLCGPSSSVQSQMRAVVEDVRTGRVIEYRTLDSEKGLTSCSSFVHVQKTGSNSHPLVGHIVRIFKHSFIGVTHTFTKVDVYDHVTEDCDCHLWFIPNINATRHIIVGLENLSKPLITAKTDSELWILDLCTN